jgi:hypothetical protein
MTEKTQHLEKQIVEDLQNLNYLFSELSWLDQEEANYEIEFKLKEDFENLIDRIFLSLVAYFEVLNLPIFLSRFISHFEQKIKERKIYEKYYHEDSGEFISETLTDIFAFLRPFILFSEDEEYVLRKKGIIYLNRVLENTDRIIKLQGKVCNNESDIYKTVKPYIEIFFPQAAHTEGHVILNKLKCYKPDLFIPDLHSAVEYKLIDEKSDIAKTISEIADDVIGYKEKIGKIGYNIFYTVYYIKNVSITKERLSELWKEREYPENWNLIAVFERN